jgi:hypothetical protein
VSKTDAALVICWPAVVTRRRSLTEGA